MTVLRSLITSHPPEIPCPRSHFLGLVQMLSLSASALKKGFALTTIARWVSSLLLIWGWEGKLERLQAALGSHLGMGGRSSGPLRWHLSPPSVAEKTSVAQSSHQQAPPLLDIPRLLGVAITLQPLCVGGPRALGAWSLPGVLSRRDLLQW